MSNRKIALTQLMTVATKSKKEKNKINKLSQINGFSVMTCTLPRLLRVIDNIDDCQRSYFTSVVAHLCWETEWQLWFTVLVRPMRRDSQPGWERTEHILSEAAWCWPAASHGHAASLQQLPSLCRVQALELETLFSSGLSSSYHDPLASWSRVSTEWADLPFLVCCTLLHQGGSGVQRHINILP